MMGMSSRALSLATVLFLIGFGAADTALAQVQNLEAGKSPSQIFTQTCTACHKSPRGLLKTVAPGSLPGFLRQHYTTSPDMAGILASYLVSNGAADTRYQAKDGKEKKDGTKEKDANSNPGQASEHQGRRQRTHDAARPEGEAPLPEGAHQKRAARPAEEGAKEGAKPEAAVEPGGRKSKRMSKRGKPATEEAPKAETAAPAAEDRKGEVKSEPNSESAKVDAGRDEPKSEKASEKPAEAKPDNAKVEPSASEAPALRPDPVPVVTPPPAEAKPAEPAAPKPAEAAPSKPAEPTASSEPVAKPQEAPAAAPAAAPAPAPAESSGPPAPPISR
jgi:hypothetical protein